MDVTTPRTQYTFDPAVARPTKIERLEGPRLALDAGSQWTHRETGETFTLTGRSRRGVYLQGVEFSTLMSVSELLAGYMWVGCNHGDYCCNTHGVHAMPHRGCVLR